ncbi:MAG: PIF1 family DEAD/DEAH box helicase [Candidatus Saccharimonadales bacterium]
MEQSLAMEIMLSGESVFLTGPAGSGKTHVLNEFIRYSRKSGKIVAVTATTGLAATHLNGNTIHAWSGMGILDEIPPHFNERLSKSRRDIIANTDILIIDEVSMLHDYRLDIVNTIAKEVRGNSQPFGGLQIILCGDFFQLPPVNRTTSRQGSFIVNSKAWHELGPAICYLIEQHRQNDNKFLEILTALRSNDIRRHHVELLLNRQNMTISQNDVVTELYTTNIDVDRLNSQQLGRINGKEHTFKMITSGKANYVDTLKKSCLAVEELVLKVGALVMCIRNAQDKKYVNGTLGKIVGFHPETDWPIIELRNGREVIMGPETWELRDGDKKRASVSQIPVRLAWAITVHKSQGMTLDAARIDLRKAFIEGMGYVALSRVRSLDSLSLSGINNMALRVSREALLIDEQLQKRALADALRFDYLTEMAKKRPKVDLTSPKKTSNWAEKLLKMREEFPNAYAPWSEKESKELTRLFDEGRGKTISELTQIFKRHPGAIEAKLKKIYGKDFLFK